jgi:hypothetical protein
VRFLPGAPEHASLLSAHGLEIVDEGELSSVLLPYGFSPRRPAAPSGAPT